ncbi:GNAT family N-acetyltransferase [Virgibacillus ainsalahensis]
MNIIFEQVLPNEYKKISEVYEIIKLSGEYMFKEQGLVHWRSPYPVEAIKKNCQERKVFLAKDIETNIYVHTFQLECISSSLNESHVAIINKFATLPEFEGRGIGKLSTDYIEEYCRDKNVKKISLDVFDKSEHAIRFYNRRGFDITGTKQTKHFTVYIMEKDI